MRSTLEDRLSDLLPALDQQHFTAAAAHAHGNLTALIAKALRPAYSSDPQVRGIACALAPALSDSDLIALILAPGASTQASYASAPTARMLLANASACIREVTLDALTAWIPAGELRTPRTLSAEFGRALALAAQPGRDPVLSKSGPASEPAPDRKCPERSDEAALLEAAQEGDELLATAVLAAASGLPSRLVHRAAELRNAKALVSLVWKCGFTMRAGTAVQLLLGQLAPSQMLQPGPAGRYPLSREEMEYQLELMTGRRAA